MIEVWYVCYFDTKVHCEGRYEIKLILNPQIARRHSAWPRPARLFLSFCVDPDPDFKIKLGLLQEAIIEEDSNQPTDNRDRKNYSTTEHQIHHVVHEVHYFFYLRSIFTTVIHKSVS